MARLTKVAKMKEEELTDENSEGNIDTEGTEGDATATDVTPEVTE